MQVVVVLESGTVVGPFAGPASAMEWIDANVGMPALTTVRALVAPAQMLEVG